MNGLFILRIVFQNADLHLQSHGALRDALVAALEASGVGEVAGRGSGPKHWSIKVEVNDLERGLEVIRCTLRGFGCPASTEIHQHQPAATIHRL